MLEMAKISIWLPLFEGSCLNFYQNRYKKAYILRRGCVQVITSWGGKQTFKNQLFTTKSKVWATLLDSASIFSQERWIITKFGMFISDSCEDLTGCSFCLNSIWLQIRGMRLKKGQFCYFLVPSHVLQILNLLFLI